MKAVETINNMRTGDTLTMLVHRSINALYYAPFVRDRLGGRG
jgi:hypothetical protein